MRETFIGNLYVAVDNNRTNDFIDAIENFEKNNSLDSWEKEMLEKTKNKYLISNIIMIKILYNFIFK